MWETNGEPFAPPTITTLTANSISKTGATLRGTFNPNVWSGTSVDGTYRFNWGLTTGYGTTTNLWQYHGHVRRQPNQPLLAA